MSDTPEHPDEIAPAVASAPPAAAQKASTATDQDFAVFLVTRAPKTVDDLTAGLAEVVRAVVETGKKGRLTYTVEIAPASKDGMADMLMISDKVDVAAPKLARDPIAVMWADDSGQLLGAPANQTSFDFNAGGTR